MEAFQTIVSPDIVDVLRAEHLRIRQLCDDVRDQKRGALAALRHAVHLHQLGESAVAHPAVRNSGPAGDAIARACQAQGAELERTVTELERRGFDDGLAAVNRALLDHVTRQERDEFPLLRRHVSTQRLHMMSGTMHDVRVMAG
ncbi:hypothetical protein FB565_006760 [Actinoplanes lutulentus]|uniref:Hemerythrin-like domain-containing protein n=1 Tax=Actinoplanes lutulentus TaxID=1287878 RepID=A0A327Z728_9ACTN|nr:hemerythrin domain-containing protein [Actinoplanes lutulentus]MBB2946992.1 hypothetical protein [Actinoplanes lutulentus]RAK30494.1 hypothetical protein B0I29_116153 [Actinoplanes lutulentus]